MLRRRIQFVTGFEQKNMVDPVLIMNDLQQKYQPLVGNEFQGTYEGELTMPQTGNPRDVLSVGPGDPLAVILGGISNAVLQTYDQQVWKGITGPEQNPNFSDYWLWVEPVSGGQLEMGRRYNFQITQCTPFPCGGDVFSHGVSIKASVIQPV